MIWLIGSKGMLGTELAGALETAGLPFTGTDREVDITDPAALRDFAGKAASPEPLAWIINCAAYTAVDKAEDDAETCRRLNVIGPGNIAFCARSTGARMIHISTDYVFDGRGITDTVANRPRPYREDDPASPAGVYGSTKREGELAALENNPRTYIIRTAWLYGRHGNNFVHTMLRLMNERDEVKVVDDQRGSPTWAAGLSAAIIALIKAVDSGRDVLPGIYHFTGEADISWFDFAREIYRQGRELGLISRDCAVRACGSADYPARAKRPAWSVLDKAKIKAALGIEIPAWDESLRHYLNTLRS
jgi:dTDP-4-dehydrorhamnose reductase